MYVSMDLFLSWFVSFVASIRAVHLVLEFSAQVEYMILAFLF